MLVIQGLLDMMTPLIDVPLLRAIVLYDVARPSRGRLTLVGGYCDPRLLAGILGLSRVCLPVHMY